MQSIILGLLLTWAITTSEPLLLNWDNLIPSQQYLVDPIEISDIWDRRSALLSNYKIADVVTLYELRVSVYINPMRVVASHCPYMPWLKAFLKLRL